MERAEGLELHGFSLLDSMSMRLSPASVTDQNSVVGYMNTHQSQTASFSMHDSILFRFVGPG